MVKRDHFSSKIGFILSASGAAVGLGNIWAFPTQVASNGGGAFLLIYLLLIVIVAFPMLVSELTIGRYGQSNPIDSIHLVVNHKLPPIVSTIAGCLSLSVPILVLVFYSIVGGWILSYTAASFAKLIGNESLASYLQSFKTSIQIITTLIFYVLTALIVQSGIKNGIERWSVRLMPTLFILFFILFIYIMTQDGALEGLKHYLIPDFTKIMDKNLILSAMGQGFFSLTIGGCSMIIYGSYLSKKENIISTAVGIALIDSLIAVLAGLVIIPAMFVAINHGVSIYDDAGHLIAADKLVFRVLPSLFDQLGFIGIIFSSLFFTLLSIAALTSSISMLEAPVALACERMPIKRAMASWGISALIALSSIIIILNFETLFGLVVTFATEYLQPIAALIICILGGWFFSIHTRIKEIEKGYPDFKQTWFYKLWPWYLKFVCPILIIFVILNSI